MSSSVAELTTERLLLRRWRDEDRAEFAAMNADPEVMQHFPEPLDRGGSDRLADRIEAGFEAHGFGLWATELVSTSQFIGFVGLSVPEFSASWMRRMERPVVEVGWRLARSAWGHGFATEGAREVIRFGFDEAGLREVVSFTAVSNERSQAVMRRLGMCQLATYGHPVRDRDPVPSVVYRLTAERG